MSKLFLAIFLIACVCAYPQKHNFDLTFDDITVKNVPHISQKPGKFKYSSEQLSGIFDFCQATSAAPGDEMQDTVNACIDRAFEMVDGFLAENFDPLDMPDMHSGFNYTLIITYHGEIDLTNGKLQDFSTIHRAADVQFGLDIFAQDFNLTLPMTFTDLKFTYDYSAKIMGLGPHGGIEGSVDNLEMEVKLDFNFGAKFLTLQSFIITDSGHINFKFTGNALIDWLLNLLTDVVTALLKKVIWSIMEDVVGGALQAAVDEINQILANGTSQAALKDTFLKNYT